MRAVFAILALGFGHAGLACSLEVQSPYELFAEATYVVAGHWVEVAGEPRFYVEDTWLGPSLPQGPYKVFFSNFDSACFSTEEPLPPDPSEQKGRQLLAAYLTAPFEINLGPTYVEAMADLSRGNTVELADYGQDGINYDNPKMLTYRKSDFQKIEPLERYERVEPFSKLGRN